VKFTFDKDLDYQRAAIDAVTGLFAGQEKHSSYFTVYARPAAGALVDMEMKQESESNQGYGNRLRLDADTIFKNLLAAQERAGLAPEPSLGSMNFTVEMETGTGKTYVYLRTIYELNQLYGFTKFVIVVPSVAIKEGVMSSISMLREHLGTLYGNPPVQSFAYDANSISRLRSFATSSGIEIMVTTIGAINKATNTIYKPAESLDNEVPVDLVRATNPIVIVDEPQSVYGDDGSKSKKKGAGRRAIEGLEALAVLRYSATHPKHDKANLVYRLDAIAAYEKQLVKQIEVDSLVTESSGVKPYVRLLGVKRTKGGFTARVEVDVEGGKRKGVTIDMNGRRNLADVTGLDRYRHLNVAGISAVPGNEYITFDTEPEPLRVGEAIGAELSGGETARQMIAQTIRQHLRKEMEFALHGRDIKVLSLFFVDSVAKYRVYDEDGEAQPGEYARIFEEEYARIAAEPEFTTLLGTRHSGAVAREAHQGYFSIDRKKATGDRWVETKETTEKGRQQASLAYEQIMKDKVGLTTPGTPIRFIFTHSALQEGWDNPNVFQVCVLRNMGSERWRRQSVGRGLRLGVDGTGNRIYGFAVNRLTVVANESYEEFAEQLQKELADDLGIDFGIVTVEGFARLTYKDMTGNGRTLPVGTSVAETLFARMLNAEYIEKNGKVSESLRTAVQTSDPELRHLVESVAPQEAAVNVIIGLIKRLAKPIDVKRSGQHVQVPVVNERLESPEFTALWDRIRHRTEYRLDISEEDLRKELVDALRKMAPVPKRKGAWLTSRVDRIDQSGISGDVVVERRVDLTYADSEDLPDILSVLADHTQLTRATLAHALIESGTLSQFTINPQAYTERAIEAIKTAAGRLLVRSLRYELVDDARPEYERRYPVTIFERANLSGYAGKGGNIVSDDDGNPISFADKSVYEHVVVDSGIEREFALRLKEREEVKAFVKLPADFTVPTPLGPYNPDWALMVERPDGSQYVVFETKSTTNVELIRPEEKGKILAAERHFDVVRAQVAPDLQYAVVDTIEAADGIMDHAATA
jgi:type III restriction enzyme